MELCQFVKEDTERRRAFFRYKGNIVKGYVVETGVEGFWWFNTDILVEEGIRDLLVPKEDVLVLV